MKGKVIFVWQEARGWTFGSCPPDNWGYIYPTKGEALVCASVHVDGKEFERVLLLERSTGPVDRLLIHIDPMPREEAEMLQSNLIGALEAIGPWPKRIDLIEEGTQL